MRVCMPALLTSVLTAALAAAAEPPPCAGDLHVSSAILVARAAGRGATLRVRARVATDDGGLERDDPARVSVRLGDSLVHLTRAADEVRLLPLARGRAAIVTARGAAAVASAPLDGDAGLEVRADDRCGAVRFDDGDCASRGRQRRCTLRGRGRASR